MSAHMVKETAFQKDTPDAPNSTKRAAEGKEGECWSSADGGASAKDAQLFGSRT